MDQNSLNEQFTYHSPNEQQQVAYQAVRAQAKKLAETINKNCPDCADKTHSIRQLRDSIMWANSSIALEGTQQETTQNQGVHA